jgi:hypothetical protein
MLIEIFYRIFEKLRMAIAICTGMRLIAGAESCKQAGLFSTSFPEEYL